TRSAERIVMSSSSRRAFLRTGALGAAAGLAVACTSAAPRPAAPATPQPADAAAPVSATAPLPQPTVPAAQAAAPAPLAQPQTPVAVEIQTPAPASERVLVVLQLSGGHDGLNAVIPYGEGLYYQMRPQIGIPADKVLHLDDQVGLHPNLTALKNLFDQG